MSISDVIVFVRSDALKQEITQALKSKNVANIVHCDNLEDFDTNLGRFNSAIAILDWECGSKEIVICLQKVMQVSSRLSHSVFLFADSFSKNFAAVAMEYNVSNVAKYTDKSKFTSKFNTFLLVSAQRNKLTDILSANVKLKQKGQYLDAIKLVTQYLNQDKENPILMIEMIELYLLNGQLAEAKKMIENFPKRKNPDLKFLHLQGKALMMEGKFDEASKFLEEANIYNPFHVERLVDLGDIYLNLGESKKACKQFDMALEIEKDNDNAKQGMGKSLLAEGAIDEAFEILDGDYNPQTLSSMMNMAAIINIRKQEYNKGIALYDKAVTLLSTNPILSSRLFYNKGIACYKKGDMIAAEDCFSKAASLDPSNENALQNLKKVTVQIAQQSKKLAAPAPAPASASAPDSNVQDVSEDTIPEDTIPVSTEAVSSADEQTSPAQQPASNIDEMEADLDSDLDSDDEMDDLLSL